MSHLRARLLGYPDGLLIRLRCLILGHSWFPCDPVCCNQWWCERCHVPGPPLDGPDPRQLHNRRRGWT